VTIHVRILALKCVCGCAYACICLHVCIRVHAHAPVFSLDKASFLHTVTFPSPEIRELFSGILNHFISSSMRYRQGTISFQVSPPWALRHHSLRSFPELPQSAAIRMLLSPLGGLVDAHDGLALLPLPLGTTFQHDAAVLSNRLWNRLRLCYGGSYFSIIHRLSRSSISYKRGCESWS
jgi:hypothetical protein